MARGWESKSIEEQQAEALANKSLPKSHRSSAEVARMQELDGLQLSRKRVLTQLQTVTDHRHQAILREALADLDRKIQALQDAVPSSST
jgi:hypothetical protein